MKKIIAAFFIFIHNRSRWVIQKEESQMAGIVLEKIIEMAVILLAGVLAYKTGLIDKTSTKSFSNVLLMLVSPLLVFQSYQMDFEPRLFYGLLQTLFVSFVTFFVCIILAEIFMKGDPARQQIEKMTAIYSNCGFIGIPLINGILGAEGVFYMTAYVTVFNVLFWTHGVWLMGDRGRLRDVWKNLFTPTIVAVVFGLIFFIFQIRLPTPLSEPVRMIGSMNTPLAMIIAGANLAQGDVRKSLKNTRLYWISFLKLVASPIIGLGILFLMRVDFTVAFTVFIAMACPAGAMTIMFAERYGKDVFYATEGFMITTVLSAVTIPLLTPLALLILKL